MHQEQNPTTATLAVIAGGIGRRMGGPKVHLRVAGQPILAWLLSRLTWPGPTLLVTAPAVGSAPGAERFDAHAVDPADDQGPLRGLLTALEHATTELIVAIPVDMPNLDREKLAWLIRQLRPELDGIMCRNRAGEIEPFPCVIRRRAAGILADRLKTGRRALHRLCDEPGFKAITTDWPDESWVNLNAPEDLKNLPPV